VKKVIIALSLFLGLLSTQLDTRAQTLGVSTPADVAKTLGTPQFDDDKPLKGYISGGNIIAVAFDDNNICQAVVLYKIKGGNVTKAEAAKFDSLVLPFGDYKFNSIPVNLVTDIPPNCTLHAGWFAVTDSSYLVVLNAAYTFGESTYEARLYATSAGIKILNSGGPGWAPQAGKKTNL
jgi:hypothetical protein